MEADRYDPNPNPDPSPSPSPNPSPNPNQAHLDAIETLVQMEINLKRSCSHCRSFKEGLTRCSRCKAAYYCGSACQMAHWKAGHAQDCCDSGPDCSHLLAMAMDTRAMAPMGSSQ